MTTNEHETNTAEHVITNEANAIEHIVTNKGNTIDHVIKIEQIPVRL